MALSETPIREALVTASQPWREVECHDEIDSTNAQSLIDPRPWRVVTSRHQRAGRGRRDRSWDSPPGTSMVLSMTVPMAADPQRWGWLPLVTGLAVVDALGAMTGAAERFALKWPNDVLAEEGGRWLKLCGILCELAPGAGAGAGAEQAPTPLVVAGVGVNVAIARQDLPVPGATSLTLAGHPAPSGDALVVAVAQAFARWHRQWYAGAMADLLAAYRTRCCTLGAQVAVHLPDGSTSHGEALDIAPGGELVVQGSGPDGAQRRTFAAGDVVHLRLADGMIRP